jgi:hypothetical protein
METSNCSIRSKQAAYRAAWDRRIYGVTDVRMIEHLLVQYTAILSEVTAVICQVNAAVSLSVYGYEAGPVYKWMGRNSSAVTGIFFKRKHANHSNVDCMRAVVPSWYRCRAPIVKLRAALQRPKQHAQHISMKLEPISATISFSFFYKKLSYN